MFLDGRLGDRVGTHSRGGWFLVLSIAVSFTAGCRARFDGLDLDRAHDAGASVDALDEERDGNSTSSSSDTLDARVTRFDMAISVVVETGPVDAAGADLPGSPEREAAGADGLSISSPPAVCAAGEVSCRGMTPMVCSAAGAWVDGPACEYACRGGCVNQFAATAVGWGSSSHDNGLAEFARNGTTFFSKPGGGGGGRGFDVAVVDPATGTLIESVRNFDYRMARGSDAVFRDLLQYLRGIPSGQLLMIVVCDDAGLFASGSCNQVEGQAVSDVLQFLKSLGSKEIGNTCFRSAWAFATITGQGRPLAEARSNGSEVTIEFDLPTKR
jgi:hypothetical protein